MIQEATKPHYSAVMCRHCRQPIPVPAIVIRMESLASPQDAETMQPERVFTLRCRACEGENPYRSSQIVDVEGEPKGRSSPRRIYRHGTLARAANA
ncbi:MAG TPA: hypothetical protein VMB47_00255 [Candidatus Aquilonibacter sp.]|nr:hypothetical protein [Candidatus Aquilonibacter sp.]